MAVRDGGRLQRGVEPGAGSGEGGAELLDGLGGLVDDAGHRVREPALLLGGAGDRGDDGVDLGDALPGDRHRLADRLGGGADRGDLALDRDRGIGGLAGELLHLGGDRGEPAPDLAGVGGLDRGVDRQHPGLPGDAADRAHPRLDLVGQRGDVADALVGGRHLGQRLVADRARALGLGADLGDAVVQLVDQARHHADVHDHRVGVGARRGSVCADRVAQRREVGDFDRGLGHGA